MDINVSEDVAASIFRVMRMALGKRGTRTVEAE
jgi:hypothetical protein